MIEITEFEYTISERVTKCRLCKHDIPRKEEHVILEVYVSPEYRVLHFHTECLHRAYDALNRGV